MQHIVSKDILNNKDQKLANIYIEANDICFVWLCGFHSDMDGSKALMMEQTAQEIGFSSLRFDYSGHGKSEGEFEEGTISQWFNDAIKVIESYDLKKIILVGSSMGGWISIKLAQHFKDAIKAMVLIAPAPDFTQDLMWNKFPEEIKKQIQKQGFWLRPSPYDENGYKVTKELIEDGNNNSVLKRPIEFEKPVRIIHGALDEDVPFMRSVDLMQKITGDDIRLNIIKNGDHRLSNQSDLEILRATLKEIANAIL